MLRAHSMFTLAPLVLMLGLHSGALLAVDDAPPPAKASNSAPAEAVPLVEPLTDIPEPDVNIREEPTQTIEEFRSQGRPYMIRVTPHGGLPAYYMVDNDGDGTLETRVNSPSNPPATPRWVLLFRW